jgi:signal transduction histidine kinase
MEDRTQTNFQDTQQHVYLIAAAAMVLIALAGLAVNVSDHASAPNSSIWPSAWSILQEEERARVAQELH